MKRTKPVEKQQITIKKCSRAAWLTSPAKFGLFGLVWESFSPSSMVWPLFFFLFFFQQARSHTPLTWVQQSRPSFKAAAAAAAGPNMAISFPSAAVYQCHSGSTMQNPSLPFLSHSLCCSALLLPLRIIVKGRNFWLQAALFWPALYIYFSRSHRSIRLFFSGAASGSEKQGPLACQEKVLADTCGRWRWRTFCRRI